jgi:hypothetical protein
MFGCRYASGLLCSLGLLKFNGIKVFWILTGFLPPLHARKSTLFAA